MTAPGFLPIGEYLYVPDMASMKLCPYAPGEASVMGWFQEKAPVQRADLQLTVEVDLCSRGILRRVVECVFLQSSFDIRADHFYYIKAIEEGRCRFPGRI